MMLLLDAAVKSSIILIVALAAASLLRRSSAAMRHHVLAAGLACAAAAPLLAAGLPGWGTALAPPFARAASPAATVTSVSATPIAPVVPAVTGTATPESISRPLISDENMLRAWAVGAASALLLLAIGFARLTWLVRGAPPASGRWQDALVDVSARYGLPRPPRLLASGHPALLVTWGAIRPTVVLPAMAAEWTPERIRVVLDHELAHVSRRDWLVQIAAEVLRCVYWFNPLVWIACRRLRQESEQACDDLVLSTGLAGTAYASHLLDLARALRPPDRLWVPAAAIARPSSLERRVAAMLTDELNREPVRRRSAIAVGLLLLTVTLPTASYTLVAQTRFASMSGTATDQMGGVLANATVVLTNSQTSAKYEVATNRTGYYEIAPLPAGMYALEVRAPGFLADKGQVTLGVGESLQRNVSLNVSNLQETISVRANDDPLSIREAARPPARKPCPDPSVGGCINPPVKLKDVTPLYPTALRDRGIEGVVMLDAVIDTEGRVRDIRVQSSPHPELDQLAVNAVSQWEFTSTLLNGRPIEVTFNTGVYFGVDAPKLPQRP